MSASPTNLTTNTAGHIPNFSTDLEYDRARRLTRTVIKKILNRRKR